jgi:hypothetical protein
LEAAIEARKDGGWNPAWAKRYAGQNPKDYGDVVGWLEDSQRESGRLARRRVWILAGVAVGLALLAAGAMWAAFAIDRQKSLLEKQKSLAELEQKRAVEAAREAKALELAAQAELLMTRAEASGEVEIELAVSAASLAIESLRLKWRNEGERAGLRAIQSPGMAIPIKHPVDTIVTGGSGHVVVVGRSNPNEHAASLVRWSDGRVLRLLARSQSIFLHPRGRFLATSSVDGSDVKKPMTHWRVLQLPSGTEMAKGTIVGEDDVKFAFDDDGRWVSAPAGDSHSLIYVFGNPQRSTKVSGSVLALHPESQKLLVRRNNAIELTDLGHPDEKLDAVADGVEAWFSPRGSHVIVDHGDQSTMSDKSAVYAVEPRALRLLRSLPPGSLNHFTSDGKHLVWNHSDHRYSVYRFDLHAATPQYNHAGHIAGKTDDGLMAAFISDVELPGQGKVPNVHWQPRPMAITDVRTGKRQPLDITVAEGAIAEFSPTGKYMGIVSSFFRAPINIFDLKSGKPLIHSTSEACTYGFVFDDEDRMAIILENPCRFMGQSAGIARLYHFSLDTDLIDRMCRTMPRNPNEEDWKKYLARSLGSYRKVCANLP